MLINNLQDIMSSSEGDDESLYDQTAETGDE
jgi:hypothetical protein